MFRVRRYRIFLIFALFTVLALYQFTKQRHWDGGSKLSLDGIRGVGNTFSPPTSPAPGQSQEHEGPGEEEQKPLAPDPTPVVDEVEEVGQGRLEPPTLGDVSVEPTHWTQLPEHFPVPSESIVDLPTGKPKAIPRIQYAFEPESVEAREDREGKLEAIKASFTRAWGGYKRFAWLQDELSPVSAGFRNPFCGWAATLVDALDTLWIMGLDDDFDRAVEAVGGIDFTTSLRDDIPLFETTIRYLGGMLGAYDISGGNRTLLLTKAEELAEVLMGAFDTPNRMPRTFYKWKPAFTSQPHRAGSKVVLAELGSLSVEFTRLAQLTGRSKYYDAIARITDALEIWQDETALPGMWPMDLDASGCNKEPRPPSSAQQKFAPPAPEKRQLVDATLAQVADPIAVRPPAPAASKESTCVPRGLASPSFTPMEIFSLGGRADSVFEYLPKEYLLLGGLNAQYKTMYEKAMVVTKEKILFRPMTPNNSDILFAGNYHVLHSKGKGEAKLEPEASHLACFVGGMLAVGAKIFGRPDELELARKVTDGCVWAYESTQTGIMPEVFHAVPCADATACAWNETLYHEALDPHRVHRPTAASRQAARAEEARLAAASQSAAVAKAESVRAAAAAASTETASAAGDEDQVEAQAHVREDKPILPRTPPPSKVAQPQADDDTDSQVGLKPPTPAFTPVDGPTHEEYVASRIAEERLPPGFRSIADRVYILRPEAIESVFIMYRVTGDEAWREKGWDMFRAIQRHTRTQYANSAIMDVTSAAPLQSDAMESFWLAETLKYFYLLFSDPGVLSLDEYVLNTEAHPFRRPDA
ncbi:MAG: hypothetical protein M1832_003162 [Thelocarpon impressellum]|nr:MAG: hypothetical protein M1832_003162 [Thelocarpon impressellum]